MSEEVHDIEYFVAAATLQERNKNKEDDWISDITGIERVDLQSCYAVSMYNGNISIYNSDD